MTNWYNSVKEIRLKINGAKLLNAQIHDWFLTAGSYPEDIINNPTRKELEAYDLFWTKLINNNNVEESINEIFSIADNVQEFCK